MQSTYYTRIDLQSNENVSPVAYLETCKPLTIFAKNFILDVSQGSEYSSIKDIVLLRSIDFSSPLAMLHKCYKGLIRVVLTFCEILQYEKP